jgi:hypothetical protein
MTNDQIIDFYDRSPDLTLKELSQMTGVSVAKLKKLLMSDNSKKAFNSMLENPMQALDKLTIRA